MKRSLILLTTLALLLTFTLPLVSQAEGTFGAASLVPGKTYTSQEMLTMAIEDEYKAQAEYEALLAAFPGTIRLNQLIRAEGAHITALTAQLEALGYPVPENKAKELVTVPATLEEAYALGVKAETQNIAIYEAFLAQTDLPASLVTTFTALKNASQNHLNAFIRGAEMGNNGRGGMANRFMNNRRGRMMQKNACSLCGCEQAGVDGN